MRISLTSVLVSDQDKALKFYTEVLGFVKKADIPMGTARWLTVISPDGPKEIELVLEPMEFAPARTYQKALYDAGIPITAFTVQDIEKEHRRLQGLGAEFKKEPVRMGPVKVAVLDDTCGNLIQLVEK